MKTSQLSLVSAALALAAAQPALAQVKCTMPNQKIIVLQTASKCPVDALKAETMDGKDITPPASERPQAQRPSNTQSSQRTPCQVTLWSRTNPKLWLGSNIGGDL